MRTPRSALFLLVIGSLASAALRADWIVTRDGEKFEIEGGWTVKGKLILFTLPGGALSSMRADQVDLAASKAATEKARKAAAPPPAGADGAKPKKKSVRVLTDRDFHKAPAASASSGAAKDAPDGKTAAKDTTESAARKDEPPSTVAIVRWDRVPAAKTKIQGVEIVGQVRNASRDTLAEVFVLANLYDASGKLVGRFPAVVANPGLRPGEASDFTVSATGVWSFDAVKFDTQGKARKAKAPENPSIAGRQPPGSS